VARFGLGTDQEGRIEVSAEASGPFLAAILGQRLTGLAAAAFAAGRLHLTRSEELLARQREVMLTVLGIERKLVSVGHALDRAGIDFLVLKGPAVAHSIYPNASWRPFGDIDLLVRTRDWPAACDVFERLGHVRLVPEPRPGFDIRFGKGAEYRGPEGIEVDLHRTLVVGPFGLWLEPEELFRHTTTFTLGGRNLPRLDGTGLLLNACLHAVLGPQPSLLMPLRDVAQLLEASETRWPALREWAVRWKLGPVLAEAFSAVERTLGYVVPREAREVGGVVSPRRARTALRTSRGEGGAAVATLRAIPGIRAKAAYVWGLMVPGRAFLASRSRTARGPSYLRRWLKPIGWLRGGSGHR
jgi:hypothetical protein